MYGWRARIGIVVTDRNTVTEPEFSRIAPDGVSVHAERVKIGGVSVNGVSNLDQGLEQAVTLLSNINARAIGFACTVANMVGGLEGDIAQGQTISAIAGCPAVTAATALYEALAALGANKVCIATPYPDELNEKTRSFWESCGVDVLSIGGVDLSQASPYEPYCSTPVSRIGTQFPAGAYNLARMAFCPGAEAVIVSGANLRSLEAIQAIEEDLGVPCISTGSAIMWGTLQAAGIAAPVKGYGKLLREQPKLQWKRLPRVY